MKLTFLPTDSEKASSCVCSSDWKESSSIANTTGTSTREAVIRGMRSGADGYVTKPLEAEALMRAVRTVLGLPGVAGGNDPWTDADAKPTSRRAR